MRKKINGMVIKNGILIDGKKAKGNVIIPNGVIKIKYEAFIYNKDITSVLIPDSVTSIGDFAFAGCIGLTSITIPNSIKNISSSVFRNCTKLIETNIPMKCLEKGSFIGYKKCITESNNHCIVKLEIPEDALRSSAISNKCRCNKAKVLSINTLDEKEINNNAYSIYDKSFVYKIGQTVKVNNFDICRWNECAPGIHFFVTRKEAVDY